MHYPYLLRLSRLTLLIAVLWIAGCAAPAAENLPTPTQAAPQPTAAPIDLPATQIPTPTPIVTVEPGETDAPAVFDDPDEFKAALLQALMDQDTERVQSWMTEPFLTGGWRADASDSAPADAVRNLYTNELGTDNRLEWVQEVDLEALMGDIDPLSFPRSEAGVIEAALVSGWGKDGRDEAVLFIARAADNSLKWHGWMTMKGGLSGARLGGNQLYNNAEYGFRIYLPKDYEVQETADGRVLVLAPGEGHPGEERAAAFIEVGPANGRSVEEIVEQVKADLGPGFEIAPGTALGLDKTLGIVLYGLPGQDSNRQLWAVYNDLLYHITFVPDNPKVGDPYWQMEDLYAMIVNTFHFTD